MTPDDGQAPRPPGAPILEIEHVVKQMNLKDAPDLKKLYDFAPLEKVHRQLEAQGWKG